MYIQLHINYPLFLSDFLDGFSENTQLLNFMILPAGDELFFADGRTNRSTDR